MSQSLNLVKNKLEELPNNIEAEQSVIGSILLSNDDSLAEDLNRCIKVFLRT